MTTREVVVRSRVAGGAERLAAEGCAILAALPSPCRLVVLDRDAKPVWLLSLGRRLESWRDACAQPGVVAVVTDLGLATEVSKRPDWRLSFGPITLPHELARLVLWEQLYRAVAISCGSSYHRKSVGSLL